MIVSRWSAPTAPTEKQVYILFELEGLESSKEVFQKNQKVSEHRHPLTEIRYIIEGQLLFNISGTQVLLRAGDRVEIPANTKHSFSTVDSDVTVSICAYRSF